MMFLGTEDLGDGTMFVMGRKTANPKIAMKTVVTSLLIIVFVRALLMSLFMSVLPL
jgi:hypothetical protein